MKDFFGFLLTIFVFNYYRKESKTDFIYSIDILVAILDIRGQLLDIRNGRNLFWNVCFFAKQYTSKWHQFILIFVGCSFFLFTHKESICLGKDSKKTRKLEENANFYLISK